MTLSDHEAVNSPAHYKQGKFETIDVIEDIVQHYDDPVVAGLIWQVLKYISRSPHKGNQQQDLQKAEFYLRRAINKSVTPSKAPV